MFSLIPRSTHLARKRIFGPIYSRSSIHSPRVQQILGTRTAELTRFLSSQTTASPTGKSGHLIPRNFIRALGTDIFTAFAFSDVEGTKFLHRLRAGANTMEDLGMGVWELWHEDKRDSFFFFESQPELKRFANFFTPHGRNVHMQFEAWVMTIMKQYEARVSSFLKTESGDQESSEQGLYQRLLTHKSPSTGQLLSWNERASEIMDHMGAPDFPIFAPLVNNDSISHSSLPRPRQNSQEISHPVVGAGHDPVPCVLEFLMQKLTQYPEHQLRLRAELRFHLPRDIDARTYSQIDSLPFLNALILEALRV